MGVKKCLGILFVLVTVYIIAITLLITNKSTSPHESRKYSEFGQRIATVRWGKHNNPNFPKNMMDTLYNRLKKATDEKTIIMWYPPYGNNRQFSVDASHCGNCVVSYNRSLIGDNRTAAVVFHFNEISPESMPTTRKPDQLHIFWTLESSATMKNHRNVQLVYEDKYEFNATATYRRDSDFLTSYHRSQDSVKEYFKETLLSNIHNLVVTKTKTAVTMVSNCDSGGAAIKRVSLLKEIKALGFNLETYGNCFKQPLPSDENIIEKLRSYKFYFAFENSYHCRDYISEKFFGNGLLSGALPVVWGAKKEDYEMAAPPNSFIHVEDFDSIKELVEYLDYLNKNDTAYLEYFKWYELIGKNSVKRTEFLCHICRAVHGINFDDVFHPDYNPENPARPLFEDRLSRRRVSLQNWFYETEDPDCMRTVS